jgi:phospholipid transport system transporter-binding protein
MLVLPSELTSQQATACLQMLVQGMKASPSSDVVVDSAALARFDSSAIAVLMECRREALALGRKFAVAGMPARLGELAALYGVAELLPAAVA